MFAFISVTLLILTAIIMVILRLVRPSFGYHWLIAAGGALLTWILLLLSGMNLPDSLELSSWGLGTFIPNSFLLSVDRTSWPFIVGLGTLLLAAFLTDVVRATELGWENWASSLLVTACGLLSVLSGNLLTFILTWTAFDIVALVILLVQNNSSQSRRRAVMIFFLHLLGTTCLFLAGVISITENADLLFEGASPSAIILVVLAAGFRLGFFPGNLLTLDKEVSRRSFGTVLRLASMTIVLVFLSRAALAIDNGQLSGTFWLLLLIFIGLISLLSGAAWILVKNELDGRQAWITGMSAIVIAATLRAQSGASLAWSLATLFSGGLLFLASVRSRFSRWIVLLGLVGISAIPYTIAWNGLSLFAPPFVLSLVLYLFALILLIWGYARHASQVKAYPDGIERWIKVVYPLGLILVLITQLGLGWFIRPEVEEVPLVGWILGPLISAFAFLGFFWQLRGGSVPKIVVNILNSILSLNWIYYLIKSIYLLLSRFINFITKVLEGEGGFLWALLWIVLFLAILIISLGT
jgi:hypothetical protein